MVILHEIVGRTENDPAYETLEQSNLQRQLDFLKSLVDAALTTKRPLLSQTIIRSLNYHAIACLHPYAGEYRPYAVGVGKGKTRYEAPEYYRVPTLMDDFVNQINRYWEDLSPEDLAAYVLWRLNWIHPFVNGNGRTARAACYFVLCVRAGGWLGGQPILPEILRQHRTEYIAALKAADQNQYQDLVDLLRVLLKIQAEGI